MSEATFEIEDSVFEHNLRTYAAKKLRNDFPLAIRRAARIGAVALAHGSNPFGDDATARAQGEGRARVESVRVYATVGKAFGLLRVVDPGLADAFYYFTQIGKRPLAEKLMQSVPSVLANVPLGSFDPKFHRDARSKKTGRVHKNEPIRQVVTNRRALIAHSKRKVRNVGFVKSAWANCARELGGTKGIPQWVTRHKRAPYKVEDNSRHPDFAAVYLTNRVDYARAAISPIGKSNAFTNARNRMMKFLELTLKDKFLDDSRQFSLPLS